MTSNEVDRINVGAALRDGLRLKTVEVVALLHNACEQLDAGYAAALPRSVDDLSITDAGTVVLPRIAPAQSARAAVASLLDELLPADSDQHTVPSALRTLPARLRDSGASKTSELKDLLTILRWHLPSESTDVLRDLVTRVRLMTADPEPAVEAIELFADETDPIPAAVLPAAVLPEAAVAARPRSSWQRPVAVAAAVLLTVGAAGLASQRWFSTRVAPSPAPVADAAPVEPRPGRITATTPEPIAEAAAPRTAQAAPPPAAPRPEGQVARALDLPVSGGAFSPSFAARGSTLLFHAGHTRSGRLFQVSLDTGGNASAVMPLLEDRGRTYHARPSPDGEWIAFDSDRDGERGVYVASRDGARVARVSGDGYAAVPSWSPDMKYLAFVRGEAARPKVWNLWLRDVATGELTRKSSFRSGQVWGASWFPDGRTLAYSHEDRLFISDAGGERTKSFASPIAGRLIRTPAVSPDGGRIVFQVYRDGAWVMDVATGAMKRILADPTAEEFAWDPDGTTIAYHSRRDGEWRIWLLELEAKGVR